MVSYVTRWIATMLGGSGLTLRTSWFALRLFACACVGVWVCEWVCSASGFVVSSALPNQAALNRGNNHDDDAGAPTYEDEEAEMQRMTAEAVPSAGGVEPDETPHVVKKKRGRPPKSASAAPLDTGIGGATSVEKAQPTPGAVPTSVPPKKRGRPPKGQGLWADFSS